MSFQRKSVSELCDYVSIEYPDIDGEVIQNLRKHKVDGDTFLQLDEEYLKEIAPLLGIFNARMYYYDMNSVHTGDRIKLKKMRENKQLPLALSQTSTPSTTPANSVMEIDDDGIDWSVPDSDCTMVIGSAEKDDTPICSSIVCIYII